MILLDFFHHHNKFVYKVDQMFCSNIELGHLVVFTAPHSPLGEGGFVVAVVHGSNFLMGSLEPHGFCFF